MKTKCIVQPALISVLLGIQAASLHAQLTIPGADGSDGVFAPTASLTIDLSKAPAGSWNGPNASPTNGVYDATKWAVVFRYSAVNIPSGVTVTFTNHASRAPVVWLVNGDVVINGVVDLSGQSGGPLNDKYPSDPGPGGFRGGNRNFNTRTDTGGFGPGGSYTGQNPGGRSGNYATLGSASGGLTYGNPSLVSLLGGSGGSGYGVGGYNRGAGGGGAMLLAVQGNVTLGGAVSANGGAPNGGGSGAGGAIRLVCQQLNANGGGFSALGGSGVGGVGGNGRIRIEANQVTGAFVSQPPSLAVPAANPPALWPAANHPSAQIVSINTVSASSDPRANVSSGVADLQMSADQAQIVVETRNLDVAATVWVNVNLINGIPFRTQAVHSAGNTVLSTWTATVTIPADYYAVFQVHAIGP